MKFAGTILAGKDKGKVIELTPDEKAIEAVKFAVTTDPEIDGEHPFRGSHVYCPEVILRHVETNLNGDPLGKQGFQNNLYRANGNATLQERDTKTDRLLPIRRIKFDIEFVDILQENGLPDLEIREFNFQKE